MLIGGNFNKKSRIFLQELAKLSKGEVGIKISVSDIMQSTQLDRAELKSVIEYLEALECISIETIGGAFLYGHISITKKGLEKANR